MSAKLDPCRPTAATERTASIIHVLLVTVSIAMTRGQASAQQSSPSQETAACSFRVPDTIPQSSPDAKVTNVPSAYIPLSGRCKFNLFLKQTYSPYTFASAGFQAIWAQAMGQWPPQWRRYAGLNDLAQPWRIRRRGDSSRVLPWRQSSIRIRAIFLRTRERSFPGCGTPPPE